MPKHMWKGSGEMISCPIILSTLGASVFIGGFISCLDLKEIVSIHFS